MPRRCAPSLLPLLVALVCTVPARAQLPCFDYATGGWPETASLQMASGAADVVATGDGHVLVAGDLGIAVYDLGDPAQPVLVDFLPADRPLREVATDGAVFAALTDDERLLSGVLTAPGQADWSGEISLLYATALAVDDGLAVFRQGISQIATIDLSDAKNPRYLGWTNLPQAFNDLAVGNGLAYLAAESSLLLICSLSDPSRPELIASAGRLASGTAVAVEFPRVHVANVSKVISYDVSTPTAMVHLGDSSRLLGYTARLSAGRGLCLGLTTGGHVYNLAAPPDAATAAVGQTLLPGEPAGLALVGDTVVVVEVGGILRTFDTAAGVHPEVVRESLGHVPAKVEVSDDLVYALDEDHPLGARLTVTHMGPPVELADIGFLPFFGTPRGLAVRGDRLVLATSFTSAALVDVTDPSRPMYLSQRGQDIATDDVAIPGRAVCALGRDSFGDETLVVYDVRPDNVLELGYALRVPYGSVQVVGWREHALVRGRFEMSGVMAVDCRDPRFAYVSDWVGVTETSVDLVAAGHHAYLLTAEGRVHVVDLSDAGNLEIVQVVDLGQSAVQGSLAVQGNILFATDYARGLSVIDISDPAAARLAGAAWVPVTGQVLAGPSGVLLNDVLYRQRSHLPRGCGALSSVLPPPAPALLALVAQPNPFNPRTELRFELPAGVPVSLDIHDLRGRRVRRLLAGRPVDAGSHRVSWDGCDDAGRPLASAVYFARLRAGTVETGAKLVLVR